MLNRITEENMGWSYLASVREAVFAITVFDKFEMAVKTSCSASDVGGVSGWYSSPDDAGPQGGICAGRSAGSNSPVDIDVLR